MLTCTWAPTVFAAPQVVRTDPRKTRRGMPQGAALRNAMLNYVREVESLGLSHLLVAQRWWGSGEEIEGSSMDCLAMTAYFAAVTEQLHLVTAIHPGFFQPSAIAKWGASIDRVTEGRWSINVTSGWNLQEFAMYGIDPLDHDARYKRSAEFIEVLRGAWEAEEFSFKGKYYEVDQLKLEPRPVSPLSVFQGGQSAAAMDLAARHSDWMFLNGGTLEKITGIIERVRTLASAQNRTVRFALYANPLCRNTDAEAWSEINSRLAAVDTGLAERRRQTVSGAEGMWASDDELSMLDTNEGFAARLIGSPDTVLDRINAFRAAGVDMLHVNLADPLFKETVLPELKRL